MLGIMNKRGKQMKSNNYKKTYGKECKFCERQICRKGHKCNAYKRFAKKYPKLRKQKSLNKER